MKQKILSIAACLTLLLMMLPLQVCAEEICTFDITGLSLPTDGATPDFSAGISQNGCSVVNVRWMDLWTDQWMSSSDRFKQEEDADGNVRSYRVEITVELTDGNVAGDNAWSITVNGSSVSGSGYEFTYYCLNNEKTQIVIEGDYVPAAHNCSGGYATCMEAAKCSTCGKEYGSPNLNNHDIFGYEKSESDSKYTTHHDLKCDLCKKTIREEEHVWGPLNHNQVSPCTVCWYEPAANVSEHTCSGGKATCAEKAYCDTCGEPYGEVDSNAHTYPETYGYVDEVGHAKICIACAEVGTIEPHVSSEDDKNRCAVCGSGFELEETETEPEETETEPVPQKQTPKPKTLWIAGGSAVGVGAVATGIVLIKKRFFR